MVLVAPLPKTTAGLSWRKPQARQRVIQAVDYLEDLPGLFSQSDDVAHQNAVLKAIFKGIYIQIGFKCVMVTKIELQPELASWQPQFDALVAEHLAQPPVAPICRLWPCHIRARGHSQWESDNRGKHKR